ncbi:alkyl sulfatase dimerization domain-containing protein [Streptomyces sp. NPDC048420]|uniref:alkyl sulfatase dimerization domain-containing protein n=1 Tax=Streptomyces sp. NPDC048420 TaxID=3155755 RepID=UPI00342F90CC
MGTIVRLKPHGASRREATALRTPPHTAPAGLPRPAGAFVQPRARSRPGCLSFAHTKTSTRRSACRTVAAWKRKPGVLCSGRCAPRRRCRVDEGATRSIAPGTRINQRPAEDTDPRSPVTGRATSLSARARDRPRHPCRPHQPLREAPAPARRGRAAEHVRDALLHAFAGLPAGFARALTWDQGSEMGRHAEFTRATGIYQRYMGWFDGNPAHLWQHPPTEAAVRYVEFTGWSRRGGRQGAHVVRGRGPEVGRGSARPRPVRRARPP